MGPDPLGILAPEGAERGAVVNGGRIVELVPRGAEPATADVMEHAGMAVGLGVDGSASNNASNLVQEERAGFPLQGARYGVAKVGHKDALRWATEGSAACLGRAELGRIAVGMQADLALFAMSCAFPAPWIRPPPWCSAARSGRIV